MANFTNIALDEIRRDNLKTERKSKIICTLGPACWSVDGLCELIDGGMNVARFNFSHGDHDGHFATLTRLREAMAKRPGSNVAVLLDTKGPEIRTGFCDPSCGGKLKLEKGKRIEVGTDYSKPCTPDYLACSYPSLPTTVKPGSSILVADGALMLKVIECKETSIIAEILNNASFGDRKNMNLPGAIVDLPTLTEKDVGDIQNWGVKNEVDFIAASFVRKGSDIDYIRHVCGEAGKSIKIISKIENQEGLENYDEILEKSDGIMVARGDLGMEIPIEKVFLAQKMMIGKANFAGKPVVTATQMLESMIVNPRPTRAECADVANAVLDGTDLVMLSGETANGEFPKAAVTMMSNTCLEAESIINYDSIYRTIRTKIIEKIGSTLPTNESVASSAVKTSFDIGAKVIVVPTETGFTARMLAKYRPNAVIVAVSGNEHVVRQCSGYISGCKALHFAGNTENAIVAGKEFALSKGYISKGDTYLSVYGSSNASGSTDQLRVSIA